MAKVVVVHKKKEIVVEEEEFEPVIPILKPEPIVIHPEPEPEVIEIVTVEVELVKPDDLPWRSPASQKFNCKTCCKECVACKHFPVCCNLPLVTSFQLLLVLDMLIASLIIGGWLWLHKYDPLHERVRYAFSTYSGNTSQLQSFETNPSSTTKTPNADIHVDLSVFAEATTVRGIRLFPDSVDEHGEALVYTKIVYNSLDYQQQIEEGCGENYYVNHLFDLNLNRTQTLFSEIIYANYISEFLEIFIDASFLCSTCCFFVYTSARGFVIITWFLEIGPIVIKLWVVVASRSHSLCIFQYGFGPHIRALDLLTCCYLLPLMLFRVYKIVVFCYFIHSLFTKSGRLVHWTKVQGVTVMEYQERHRERLKMFGDGNDSSSDAD